MWETWVRSLGREDPLEKEMATHSSTFAWRIPWREETGGLQCMGSQRVRHEWATFAFTRFVIAFLPRSKRLLISWLQSPFAVIFEPKKMKCVTASTSVQFSSVAQPCPTLCDPLNRSMPGLPVHHQLPEFTQTHVHWAGDAIQPSHPLSSPSPPSLNLCQH